jgi:DNA-directed RNA polymerase specialized sigma24 family protein
MMQHTTLMWHAHAKRAIFGLMAMAVVAIMMAMLAPGRAYAVTAAEKQAEAEAAYANLMAMQETLDRLYQAIEQLPQHLREIFDLSFREGLQNAEVAARLRVSVEAVKKRKARLVSLLRERFRGNASMTFLLNLPPFILF